MNLETSKMGSIKQIAIIVGILFLIADVAGVLSLALIGPLQGTPDHPDYLTKFAASPNLVLVAALLIFIMGAACTIIAFCLYPILRRYNEALAIGAVGFRLVEGLLDIVVVIGLILLLALSQEYVKAGAPASSYFQTLGVLIMTGINWVNNVGVLMTWCLAAAMYYYIFYQMKLVPRWLSAWGLVGVPILIAGCLLLMFNFIDTSSHTLFALPLALQELVFALWLIVKGFNPFALVAEPQ